MPVILMFLKKYWLHIAAAVALIGACWWTYNQIYDAGYNDANASWEKKWIDQAAKLAEDRVKDEQEQRAREQYWQQQLNEVQQNAEQKIIDLEADLVIANSTADGVRDHARRMAERASKACSGSGTGAGGTSTESTSVVLAELFTRADEVAGELAEAYDRARIAGLACERGYGALRD